MARKRTRVRSLELRDRIFALIKLQDGSSSPSKRSLVKRAKASVSRRKSLKASKVPGPIERYLVQERPPPAQSVGRQLAVLPVRDGPAIVKSEENDDVEMTGRMDALQLVGTKEAPIDVDSFLDDFGVYTTAVEENIRQASPELVVSSVAHYHK